MHTLYASDAVKAVKYNFDEQEIEPDEDLMLGDTDSQEFANLAKKLLPDAINAVHSKAPIEMLDGEPTQSTSSIDEDGVMTITIAKPLLRFIAFKASGSKRTITELLMENSPEGRLQNNPYTRGTSWNPKLVLQQGKTHNGEYGAVFKYYTTASGTESVSRLELIPKIVEQSNSYKVADNVMSEVIDQLTGMMLTIYNEPSKAEVFLNRASFVK